MNEHISRRGLIVTGASVLGMAGLHAVAAQETATPPATTAAPAGEAMDAPATETAAPMMPDASDMEILNFALGLEFLEREFYTRAVEAHTARPFLKGRLAELLPIIRDHETAHAQILAETIAKLGGTAVAPAANYNFPNDVFISPVSFARYATMLEEVGIGAYLGAAGKIKNRDLRRAAASIYGNETRHAALLRHYGGHVFSSRYYEGPLTVAEVQSLIAPIIGAPTM